MSLGPDTRDTYTLEFRRRPPAFFWLHMKVYWVVPVVLVHTTGLSKALLSRLQPRVEGVQKVSRVLVLSCLMLV